MRRELLTLALGALLAFGGLAPLTHAQASGSCVTSDGKAGTLDTNGSCNAILGAEGSCEVGGKAGTLDGNGTCIPDLTGEDLDTSPGPTTNQNPFKNNRQVGGGINMGYIQGYADDLTFFINDILVPVLIAIAFFTFLLGVYQYFILGATEPAKLKTGRAFVLWGAIGFAAIFSVWGLVWLVLNTFSLQPGGVAPSYPLL